MLIETQNLGKAQALGALPAMAPLEILQYRHQQLLKVRISDFWYVKIHHRIIEMKSSETIAISYFDCKLNLRAYYWTVSRNKLYVVDLNYGKIWRAWWNASKNSLLSTIISGLFSYTQFLYLIVFDPKREDLIKIYQEFSHNSIHHPIPALKLFDIQALFEQNPLFLIIFYLNIF